MLACLKGILGCCSYPFGIYFFYTLEANLEGFFCFCFLSLQFSEIAVSTEYHNIRVV